MKTQYQDKIDSIINSLQGSAARLKFQRELNKFLDSHKKAATNAAKLKFKVGDVVRFKSNRDGCRDVGKVVSISPNGNYTTYLVNYGEFFINEYVRNLEVLG